MEHNKLAEPGDPPAGLDEQRVVVHRRRHPGDLRMVRGEQVVKPGWADRFHDAMKKKKAAAKK